MIIIYLVSGFVIEQLNIILGSEHCFWAVFKNSLRRVAKHMSHDLSYKLCEKAVSNRLA